MKNKGFTLVEILIACGVLALFMSGVIALYSSGSKMSNSTMWLQNTTNKLRSATRLISECVRKGSYPTQIEYPKEIKESRAACFDLHYHKETLTSAESDKAFLIVTESKPVKKGETKDVENGELKVHVFKLLKNGDLTYGRYDETGIKEVAGDSFTRAIPPKGSPNYQIVLVKDVESVVCVPQEKRDYSPLEITVNCVMPRNKATKRSEKAIGVPNVKLNDDLK